MIYKSIIGKDFELTTERNKHIFLYHPDLKPYFSKLKSVFLKPGEIRISKSDPNVLLFISILLRLKQENTLLVWLRQTADLLF